MQSVKAVVRNGRLVLDEPTELPEGTEVQLLVREGSAAVTSLRKLSVDELLATRLTPAPGVGPVTLADMDRAIADGVARRGSL